jgi:KDO2-lipid IV(A) lauroyltransferase
MPEKSAIEVELIIKGMWDNMGRVVGEFVHIFDLSEQEFKQRLTIEGLENVPLDGKSGVIFFSAHLGNWEIAPRFPSSCGINTALIYRKANNKLVDDLMLAQRSKNNILAIQKGISATKKIISHLKKRGALTMLVDQKMNDGIAVPFFNHMAMTPHAIAKLAKNYQAIVIPSQIIRTHKANFILKFYPPIDTTKSDYEVLLNINQILELWIKEHPTQWMWVHNRWGKM